MSERLIGFGVLFFIAVVSRVAWVAGILSYFLSSVLVLGVGSDSVDVIFSFHYWNGYWDYFIKRSKQE